MADKYPPQLMPARIYMRYKMQSGGEVERLFRVQAPFGNQNAAIEAARRQYGDDAGWKRMKFHTCVWDIR